MRVLADTCEFWNCGQGPFSPQGPVADHMHSVFVPFFIVSVIVFVATAGAIIYAALRFRRRSDDEEPAQIHGNDRLEVAWTLAPFAILIGLFIWTAVNMPFINNVPADKQATAMSICVQGQQFNWTYVYYNDAKFSDDACSAHKRSEGGKTFFTPAGGDKSTVVTTKLMVPTGVAVKLTIVSSDVNHSFYIPTVGGQVNAIPGLINDLWFQLDNPGKYHGACTELCGLNHAGMLIEIDALSQQDYTTWYQQQKAAKAGGGATTSASSSSAAASASSTSSASTSTASASSTGTGSTSVGGAQPSPAPGG